MTHIHKFLIAITLCLFNTFPATAKDLQQITLAGGCFWCVESDYESINGVVEAVSGYTGGKAANANYKKVSKGRTKHLEAVQITFDADIVTLGTLMNIFWRTIDPTDAGGQFCDRGASYRTAVFVGKSQRAVAEASKSAAAAALKQKIVTPILNASIFYPAEAYHQNYYKSSKKVLTRYGLIKKKNAYKRYRKSCGRDARVKQLWGNRAFVVAGS